MRLKTGAWAGTSRSQLDAQAYEDPRAPSCRDRAAFRMLHVQKAYLWSPRKLGGPIFPEFGQVLWKLPEWLNR